MPAEWDSHAHIKAVIIPETDRAQYVKRLCWQKVAPNAAALATMWPRAGIRDAVSVSKELTQALQDGMGEEQLRAKAVTGGLKPLREAVSRATACRCQSRASTRSSALRAVGCARLSTPTSPLERTPWWQYGWMARTDRAAVVRRRGALSARAVATFVNVRPQGDFTPPTCTRWLRAPRVGGGAANPPEDE